MFVGLLSIIVIVIVSYKITDPNSKCSKMSNPNENTHVSCVPIVVPVDAGDTPLIALLTSGFAILLPQTR